MSAKKKLIASAPILAFCICGICLAQNAVVTPKTIECDKTKPKAKFQFKLPFTYSVNGEKGIFTCQVSNRDFDAEAKNANNGEVRRFASERGEFQDKLLPMPITEKAIQQKINEMAAKWPYEKPSEIKVRILGTNSKNAAALADNSMKVQLGLLSKTSDQEVAFLLGHEYSHILLGHLKRNETQQKFIQMITTLVDSYVDLTTLAQYEWNEASQSLSFEIDDKESAKIGEALRKSKNANARMQEIATVIIAPVYKRAHEDEADALGLDLSAAANLSTENGPGLLFPKFASEHEQEMTFFEQMEIESKANLDEALKIQSALIIGQASTGTFLQDLGFSEVWRKFKKGIAESAKKAVSNILKREHRSPEDRMKGLKAYKDAAYPEGFGEVEIGWLAKIQNTPEFKNAVIATNETELAEANRRKGEYDVALSHLKKAKATTFGNTPMVINEEAYVYRDMGKIDLAHTTFLKAHKSELQSLQAFRDDVDMLSNNQKWAQLINTIGSAKSRFNDISVFYPALIRAASKSKDDKSLNEALIPCMAIGLPDLMADCAREAPAIGSPEFMRLKPDTQATIIKAKNKISEKDFVSKATDIFKNVFDGLSIK